MKKRKMAAMIITTLLIFCMSGCTGIFRPAQPTQPTPAPSPSATITPASCETTEEPTDQPEETPFTGDVKAYLQAGLPARDKMTPVQKWYYYDRDNEEADYEKYNTEFEGSTKADLDGDGKQDDISLTFPDAGNDAETGFMTVKVNGASLEIDGDFIDTGIITDIDAGDGRKEVCINLMTDDYSETYVVIYEKGKLLLLPGPLQNFSYADGTGYVNTIEFSNGYKCQESLNLVQPLKLKEDRTGFEELEYKYYVVLESNFPEKDTNWDAAETAWTQKLAKAPSGKEEITVKKGTLIFLGLYDPKGWLQILDEEGNQLGWLNLKTADYQKYIDHAIGIG